MPDNEEVTGDVADFLQSESQGIDPDFEDQSQEEDVSPPLKYKISSYGTDLEVELLVSRLEKGVYLIPEYQRGYVWTQARASQFIESLLLGLPIPGIFLYKDSETNKFLVIDGHQRLKTLQGFANQIFPETDRSFTLKKVDEKYLGKTYKSLLEEDQRALDSSVIHATIIEQESPQGDKSSIYHIFKRINSGAVPLTPQEIRFCVNYGDLALKIKELNDHESWRILVGPKNSRMKDQELILRFFALFFKGNEYKAPMQGFLDQFLEKYRNSSDTIEGTNFSELFRATSDCILERMGSRAFRIGTPVNSALADSILVSVAHHLTAGSLGGHDLRHSIGELLDSSEFRKFVDTSTADESNVSGRIRFMFAALGASE